MRNRLKTKCKGVAIGSGPRKSTNILKTVNRGNERRSESFNDGSVIGRRVGLVLKNLFAFNQFRFLGVWIELNIELSSSFS